MRVLPLFYLVEFGAGLILGFVEIFRFRCGLMREVGSDE